jgi:hypothetical protein
MCKAEVTSKKSFPDVHKHFSVFISHAGKDADVAEVYRKKLGDTGFDCYAFEKRLGFGDDIEEKIGHQIETCDFFVLILSEAARKSEWVQRELGLAWETAKNRAQRERARRAHETQQGSIDNPDVFPPFIIAIKPTRVHVSNWLLTLIERAKCEWLGKNNEFREFPCKKFYARENRPSLSGNLFFLLGQQSNRNFEKMPPYPLNRLRGFDAEKPSINDIDFLIDKMRVKTQRVGVDINSNEGLANTGFYELYHLMFPPEERIPDLQLCKLLFTKKHGTNISLRDNTSPSGIITYTYNRQPIMWLLTLRDRTIGFALVSYDHTTRFLFGSYLAIHERWRGTGLFKTFGNWIKEQLLQEFPENRGIIFEIEPVDIKDVQAVVDRLRNVPHLKDLPRHGRKTVLSKGEEEIMRKFLRLAIYRQEARLFCENKVPLEYFQPCMDLEKNATEWESFAWPLWLAYKDLRENSLDNSTDAQLWKDVMNCVVVELIGKSYAMDTSSAGAQYLRYAESVRDMALAKSADKTPSLESVIECSNEWDMLHRAWRALKVKIPL